MADSGFIIDETALGASKASLTIDIPYKRSLSLVYSWGGTLNGTLKLQCRNHSDQEWTDVSKAVFPSQPAGSAGKDEVSFTRAEARYYRVYFTYSSGSGALQVACLAKLPVN